MNIDNIVNVIFKRKHLYVFGFYLSFFFFNNYITKFLAGIFIAPSNFSNNLLDWLIIISSIILTLYLIYLALFREYRLSFIQHISLNSLILIPFYYYGISNSKGWEYYTDSHLEYEYLWYFLIPFCVFAVLTYSLAIRRASKGSKTHNQASTYNYVVSDTPIYSQDNDLLNHSKIVNRLTTILLNDKHKKAISIGLVGPWGNGKSSVLNFVKDEVKKEIDFNNDIILISFYPYLNHEEEDIISEFFNTLSGELSKYSGKLSNQVLSYAQKLTGLYKDKNIAGFFDKHITKLESTPAIQYYTEIDDLLIELDKKIIVMVDDLDRLNDKEILQVLKLIRNTADFSNMIFVVAMDKDYTLSVLKSNKQILNANFLDKFFQFEVYLPEIDNSILRNQFYKLLSDSILGDDPDFIVKLKSTINNSDNLFNDYIKNFRDVKRIVNQIIFDYPLLVDEIDFKDFVNFIYFKLKFPKFMKLLNDNRLDYLEHDTSKNIYTLRSSNISNDSKKTKLSASDIQTFGRVKFNDVKYLEGYDLYNKLIKEECLQENLSIDCKDLILLLKTLVHLFGSKNKIKSATSIRKVNNFRMLLQQRVFENALLEKEFTSLIKDKEIIKNTQKVENLFQNNKITQLIDRFNYFNSDSETDINSAILILAYLYQKNVEFGLVESDVLRELAVNVQRKFKSENLENETSKTANWIDQNLFSGNFLNTQTKLLLLGNLWDVRKRNDGVKFWRLDSIDDNYFINRTGTLFQTYLEENKELWEVNNFSFYRIYHTIKIIDGLKSQLNKDISKFWNSQSVELLCVQSISFEAFSISAFELSDGVEEIFGSKLSFVAFIKNHKDFKKEKKSEIIELVSLLDLMLISNFQIPILFTFGKSQLMLKKITLHKQNTNRSPYDEFKDWKQIFLSSNSKEVIDNIVKYRVNKKEIHMINGSPYIPSVNLGALDLLQFALFSKDGLEYLVISYNKKYGNKYASLILESAIEISNLLYGEDKSSKISKNTLTGEVKLSLTDKYYIGINSIQTHN